MISCPAPPRRSPRALPRLPAPMIPILTCRKVPPERRRVQHRLCLDLDGPRIGAASGSASMRWSRQPPRDRESWRRAQRALTERLAPKALSYFIRLSAGPAAIPLTALRAVCPSRCDRLPDPQPPAESPGSLRAGHGDGGQGARAPHGALNRPPRSGFAQGSRQPAASGPLGS
jgi:hypothetical protein